MFRTTGGSTRTRNEHDADSHRYKTTSQTKIWNLTKVIKLHPTNEAISQRATFKTDGRNH